MDECRSVELTEQMSCRRSDELTAIVENRDSEWTPEAVEAARHVLVERGESVPEPCRPDPGRGSFQQLRDVDLVKVFTGAILAADALKVEFGLRGIPSILRYEIPSPAAFDGRAAGGSLGWASVLISSVDADRRADAIRECLELFITPSSPPT